MSEKHELADKYIVEVREEYERRGRQMGETVVAIALIRACEDLLIEREKIQRIVNYLGVSAFGLSFDTRPGETPEADVSRVETEGDAIVPDTPVSLDPAPSSQAVFAGDGPESHVACPNCNTQNPIRNIGGNRWYLCHFCDYQEKR